MSQVNDRSFMEKDQIYDPNDPFKVGNELCWLYGEHYRVAKVLEVEDTRVKLSCMTADYWLSKKTLLPRLDRTPHRVSGFF
jgi:hypothetical protein